MTYDEATHSDDKFTPPVAQVADAAQIVVRAAASAIPLVGGPAAELINALFSPIVERRKNAWMDAVADAIRTLQRERRISPDELILSDSFGDALLQSTYVALRTTQDTKRAALRAALINTALPDAPEAAIQQMYLSFVDHFSEWHLRVLRLFKDPVSATIALGRDWPTNGVSSLSEILELAYPELKGRREFYEQVWRDLWVRGLVELEGIGNVQGLVSALPLRQTTDFGCEFLNFITDPFAGA